MSDPIDQEMRDLLIRLDQKVSDGFQSITQQIASIDSRVLRHDTRIDELERWKISSESSTKSYFTIGKIIWSIVAAIAGFVGSQALNVTVVKTPPVAVVQAPTSAPVTVAPKPVPATNTGAIYP
jgi:hypothetical protein